MSYFPESFDKKVIRLLKSGAVGFMPSDTIYGLSCRALDQRAVEKLYNLKDRKVRKPFIILISNYEMLRLLGVSYDEVVMIKRYWPGPLTVIFPAPAAPAWLQLGLSTLAVRMPNESSLRNLIDKVGPIVSTSANKRGDKPATTSSEARKIFGDKLDFYIDAGEMEGQPSTIVKVKSGKLEVVREGAIKINDI